MKRKQDRSAGPQVEALERRALLAVVLASNGQGSFSQQAAGLTATWLTPLQEHTDSGESEFLQLRGIPAHSSISVYAELQNDPGRASGASLSLKGKVDGIDVLQINSAVSDLHVIGQGGTSHTGGSATIEFTGDVYNAEYWYVEEVRIEVDLLPIVSISAGGLVVEDGSGDGGWVQATRSGGDISQPLTVKIKGTRSGGTSDEPTAEPRTDYEVPSTIVIPANASVSPRVQITPIDDPDAEGIETIRLEIEPDNRKYLLDRAAPPATTQIDDDVTVKSIEIGYNRYSSSEPAEQVLPDDAGYAINGYKFATHILVKGEHVDQLRLRQLANASATIIDKATGEPLPNEEVAKRFPRNDEYDLGNTGGQDRLDGHGSGASFVAADAASLNIWNSTKNGSGYLKDSHTQFLTGGMSQDVGRVAELFERTFSAKVQLYKVSDQNRSTLREKSWSYHYSNLAFKVNVAGLGWVAQRNKAGAATSSLFSSNPIGPMAFFEDAGSIKYRKKDGTESDYQ